MQKTVFQQKTIGFIIGLMLIAAVFLQSMVMAVAIGTMPAATTQNTLQLDAYGSQICGDNGHGIAHKTAIPECCLSGCILSVAARNFLPAQNFLTINMRVSEALSDKSAYGLVPVFFPFHHHARAPPFQPSIHV